MEIKEVGKTTLEQITFTYGCTIDGLPYKVKKHVDLTKKTTTVRVFELALEEITGLDEESLNKIKVAIPVVELASKDKDEKKKTKS